MIRRRVDRPTRAGLAPRPARPSRAALLLAVLCLATGLAACASRPTAIAAPHPASASTTSAPTTTTAPTGSPVAPTTSAAPPPAASNTPSAASSSAPASTARWVPAPGTAWQWQLTDPVDTSVDVPVYDVDSTYTSAATVAALHSMGRKVICYVNAGAWEDFRPDQQAFPSSVLGDGDGWPGEKWLDIRQISILEPIMAARFEACRAKGFDGIEADLVDGYTDTTGFPLTAADQLRYDLMLAGLAHGLGLSIGLKNDLDQVPQLVGVFDFAINEQCFQYSECDQLLPFIKAGKAVFEVEYQLSNSQFCAQADEMGFSSMRKNLALDAPRWPC